MTPSDIARIRLSFAVLAEDPDGLAAEFYATLFSLAPDLRPLFRSDLREQGRKLVGMLTVVVRGLDDLGAILGAARSLGERHVSYGVKPADYALVGAALLATIEARLGQAYTEEVGAAWGSAYGVLSSVMIGPAAEQAACA